MPDSTNLPLRTCALCRGPIPIDRDWRVLYCSRRCRDRAQRARYNQRYGHAGVPPAQSAPYDPDALLKQVPPDLQAAILKTREDDKRAFSEWERKAKEAAENIFAPQKGSLFEPVIESVRATAYPDEEEEAS